MAVYYKIEIKGPVNALLTVFSDKFLSYLPNNLLAVERNVANTFAWIKLPTELLDEDSPLIVDTAFEQRDHQRVIDDMNTVEWSGVDPNAEQDGFFPGEPDDTTPTEEVTT